MQRCAVYHVSSSTFAYPVSKDTLAIRLQAARDDLKEVNIYFRNLYEHVLPMTVKKMTKILWDENCDMYEVHITVPEKRFQYYFELTGKDSESIFFTSDGFLEEVAEKNCYFFPYINDDEIYDLPEKWKGALIYQILIDRFFDGDSSNNPQNVKDIDVLPDRDTYYGGDFRGLTQKLDYIRSLGAELIYLSPVFLSPTYHKYDTIDYYQVEDIYGGRDELIKLIKAANEKGLGILLDGVFNHASDRHPFFLDLMEKGKGSKYRDWFCVFSYDEEGRPVYDSFGGVVPSMPRWNICNEEVVEYLADIACYWTENLNIAGWRFDVADEVPHSFWKTMRKRLKKINPKIVLIGEIWNHATPWLEGDEFDSVTNYKLRTYLLELAQNKIDVCKFWQRVGSNLMLYKTPVWPYLVNLLGSHDTIRLFTEIKDKRKAELALLTMLCMEGMPLIYYGDEIGMEGNDDPDNRRAMQWGRNTEFLTKVQNMGELRQSLQPLRCGRMIPISTQGGVLCFIREHDGNQVEIIANYGDEPKKVRITGNIVFKNRVKIQSDGSHNIDAGGILVKMRYVVFDSKSSIWAVDYDNPG